ncbi:4-hydroxy-3-polyprenylbenzoate decarboxylase [Desulfuromusa kysingii]|uniref:4-hydroxy-3-polyprenylbenzoate decarboxylase n=1 Tax=Desulfuromusa kysingii TaxID=37625 RepID=A0A1H3VLL0_9BACT|nr:UbiD family decarboxylase [Desulfuromusa kysingii]SDZ75693.1 4-hydroxy-3-polyprenylbenzoate decarboxylase [Desulfuromusa kysingii]
MNFRTFLQNLAAADQLQKVLAVVDPHLELAALCRREFAKDDGGKALLFSKVKGSSFPVIANIFGSERRTGLLLHSDNFDIFAGKVIRLLNQQSGTVEQRMQFDLPTPSVTPTTYNLAAPLDLTALPSIKTWPQEGGRYLNLALALTEDIETKQQNLGLYRAQVMAPDLLALNFSPNSGAAQHFVVAAKAKKALPISLVLGSDPALIWVAAAPLPENCNEFAFHDALFSMNTQFTAGLSQPLAVPADAEIIIEGEIIPDKVVLEGPFGNHTGQYVTRSDCPLMRVTAIRCRSRALMPTTVVGPPQSENVNLGRANEILLREMIKIDFPQVCNLMQPLVTIFHGVTLLTVQQQSMRKNRELLTALWENSPLRRSPLLVLLDEDIELTSLSQCWWRTINRLKEPRIYRHGHQLGIDATGVSPSTLVTEDQLTRDLLLRRKDEYYQC